MKTGDDFNEDIAKQEEKSSRKWNRPDRETSPTERKANMWKRTLKNAKTDKEI